MRSTAFFKFYKICILSHRCNPKILAKNRLEKSAVFVKFQQKCLQILHNLQNFAKFQKIQLDNLADFEKCCKTRIYTPPLGGQKTQAYCLAPQKNLLTGCVSKPFSKHMWRPEMRWCDDGMMWCRDDGMMWWWNNRLISEAKTRKSLEIIEDDKNFKSFF